MTSLFTIEDVLAAAVHESSQYDYKTKLMAVRLVLIEDWTQADAARKVGVNASYLGKWVADARCQIQRAMGASRDQGGSEPGKFNGLMAFRAVVGKACEACGANAVQFFGRGRAKNVVVAREVSAWVGHERLCLSYPVIAAYMNRPNHSSIITMARRLEQHEEDPLSLPTGYWTRRAMVEHVWQACRVAA